MNAPALVAADALHVGFRLRGRGWLHAVENVSLTVQPGETLGVIGESGSGKSTLGRALVCLTPPTRGRVLHNGQDPHAMGARALRRHRAAYQIIFQDPNAALDPRMTVGQLVREPLDTAHRGDRAERTRQAARLLDRVGLSREQADRYPHELSGGQKQRVNIARALALSPRFLVCDEVVAALDVSIQASMLNLFASLQRDFGLTYLFITHDIGVVAHVSDRIAVMYLGRIVELGAAAVIAQAPLHPYTRALLSAEPEPLPARLRSRARVTLQGEIPSPLQPPSGCRFRTRCPQAAAICAEEEPEWRRASDGHFVACHFAPTAAPGRIA